MQKENEARKIVNAMFGLDYLNVSKNIIQNIPIELPTPNTGYYALTAIVVAYLMEIYTDTTAYSKLIETCFIRVDQERLAKELRLDTYEVHNIFKGLVANNIIKIERTGNTEVFHVKLNIQKINELRTM